MTYLSVRTMALSVALALATASCHRGAAEPPTPPAAPEPPAPEATVLLSLPVSAYQVTLAAGADGTADLLTASAAYRLAPGREPIRTPLDLGFGAAATSSSYVYWSGGAIRETPKAGGPTTRLAALPERPMSFVASDRAIGWLRRSDDGHTTLQALRGKQVTTLYASPGTIDAVAISGDTLFFVERPGGTDWRIGRVAVSGGAATFTAPRGGRPPAMLAADRDLAFYVGAGFEVHRLSLDLLRERTVASHFICSPLAVADAVYCAQEGLYELRLDTPPRRLLPGNLTRPVTTMAVGPKALYWVADDGADRLVVKALPLP
jgi:hypothetical protein